MFEASRLLKAASIQKYLSGQNQNTEDAQWAGHLCLEAGVAEI